ncbi:MAG: serine-protein kinase RsbW [Frankiales bacterium]|nr:serine-protein kinase RsbW [Frankiales bacterium]
MAVVELQLSPLPAHVRTARLVVVAAARRAGLDDERVDELRLALGEACSRAVGLHRLHAPDQPVLVTVQDDAGRLTVVVTDCGPAAGPVPDDVAGDLLEGDAEEDDDVVAPDVALAVVTGLVDDVTVEPGPGGTTVTMRWPLAARQPGTVL